MIRNLPDATLLISYDKSIVPVTMERDFHWFDGYDYVLDGSEIERFLDLVDQYSECDTSAIRAEISKKKTWNREQNGDNK